MQGFRITKTAKAFFKGIYNTEFLRANGMFRIALCEWLACLDAKVLHRSVRRSCMPRCECLALPDAKVLHCSVRMSRMAPCEFSHRLMRMSRMAPCECLEIPVFSCLFILPPTLKKVIFFVILANILLINKEV